MTNLWAKQRFSGEFDKGKILGNYGAELKKLIKFVHKYSEND
jgi:hypothetical protein